MTLEVPEQVVMSDGSTAEVKGVAARIVAGRLAQVVLTVETASGAWTDVAGGDAGTTSDATPTPTSAPTSTSAAAALSLT